jgi:CubicO group peptidase (beta-lactamase class C family)
VPPTRRVLQTAVSAFSHRDEEIADCLANNGPVPDFLDPDQLQSRLGDLLAEHKVPGAVLGVLHKGEVIEVAAGVANLNTGIETTTDTVFQIGSMGKSWTATVIMTLVDEGSLDLDEPVQRYLPQFSVADSDVSSKVTLRHLLSHTSGIDGDHFLDTGRGDDCLERYVESCAGLGQTHPLGATMSYCNSGYSVAGRMIEVLDGKVWDQAMRDRLFAPLGLSHTSTLAEEAILERVALGHVSPKPGEPPVVSPVWTLPRSCGPMGIPNSTVGDVLAFARMHLQGGVEAGGKQILSPASVKTMQEPQIEVPDPHSLGSHWGVGWILFDWNGRRLYGHDGNTLGQASFLRIAPDADLAITLLTNLSSANQVYRALFSELLSDLADIKMPPQPTPPETPFELDLSKYAGIYERLAVRIELTVDDGRLAGTVTLSGPLAKLVPNPVTKLTLTPVDTATFLALGEDSKTPSPAVFYGFEEGIPRFLHTGARAHPRVTD